LRHPAVRRAVFARAVLRLCLDGYRGWRWPASRLRAGDERRLDLPL